MKGITYCGACADYDYKKHRCRRGAKSENKPQDPFYDDCPLADVEPVRRWIPCSERLPEDEIRSYLCWYEYFRYGSYNAMYQTCGIGYYCNGRWGGEVAQGRDAKVLYWMPLPEPPKEGGVNDGTETD